MKNILVPTDFSDNAETAMNFAIMLAKQQNARILLLNVFELSFAVDPVQFEIINAERKHYRRQMEEKIQLLGRKLQYAGNQNYECFVEEGPTVDTITEFAKRKNADLIIMGTKGETGLDDFIFGTTTSEVIEKAGTPVLAIPQGIDINEPIKRITYATNFLKSDLAAIKLLTTIAEPIGAGITILHIAEKDGKQEEEVKKLGDFMNQVTSAIGFGRFGFELINGEDAEAEIKNYIAMGKTDLLVLSTQYRNFFGRLLDFSTTKKIVQSSTIPVIAFHHRKEKPVNVY